MCIGTTSASQLCSQIYSVPTRQSEAVLLMLLDRMPSDDVKSGALSLLKVVQIPEFHPHLDER